MLFQLAGIEYESIVDGPGVRLAVFFQGCNHKCPGCHNPKSWDFSGGNSVDTTTVINHYKSNPMYSGITLTGGDPVYQPEAAFELAQAVHELNGNVWLYTGFTMEELKCLNDNVQLLVSNVDAIVDGPFKIEERDLSLQFRGSRNQCIYEKKNGKFVKVV